MQLSALERTAIVRMELGPNDGMANLTSLKVPLATFSGIYYKYIRERYVVAAASGIARAMAMGLQSQAVGYKFNYNCLKEFRVSVLSGCNFEMI